MKRKTSCSQMSPLEDKISSTTERNSPSESQKQRKDRLREKTPKMRDSFASDGENKTKRFKIYMTPTKPGFMNSKKWQTICQMSFHKVALGNLGQAFRQTVKSVGQLR